MFRSVASSVQKSITRSRAYHSLDHPKSNAIVDSVSVNARVLNAALALVPKHGFSDYCVEQAVRDMGYPDSLILVVTANPNGSSAPTQLMIHWLQTQRQALARYATDPSSSLFHSIPDEYERAAHLIKKRLHFNKPIIDQLGTGISNMILPSQLSLALGELQGLGDDIAHYAGDELHDFAWYSKRFAISSVYVSSELFMMQDTTKDYSGTHKFVDGRIAEVRKAGQFYSDTEQWGLFNAIGLVNLIKSQWVRG